MLSAQGVAPLDPGPKSDPAKVALGKVLFFDKELSGNRDVSLRHLSPAQARHRRFAVVVYRHGRPRRGAAAIAWCNAACLFPATCGIFNRGSSEWHTMFWDGRVLGTYDEGFTHPAEFTQTRRLAGLTISSPRRPCSRSPRAGSERRAATPETTTWLEVNEVGSTGEKDLAAVWRALTARLVAIPAYRELFAAAYPDVPADELGFEHAANAIAAFEADAFTLLDSPWDRYLNGDDSASSDQAMQGALLFYGKAQCSQCHSGASATDQKFHNIGVPQLGPGKGRANRYFDPGRARDRQTGGPLRFSHAAAAQRVHHRAVDAQRRVSDPRRCRAPSPGSKASVPKLRPVTPVGRRAQRNTA